MTSYLSLCLFIHVTRRGIVYYIVSINTNLGELVAEVEGCGRVVIGTVVRGGGTIGCVIVRVLQEVLVCCTAFAGNVERSKNRWFTCV